MARETALAQDLSGRSIPADAGFCTYQPVVDGGSCLWKLDYQNFDKFVLTGAEVPTSCNTVAFGLRAPCQGGGTSGSPRGVEPGGRVIRRSRCHRILSASSPGRQPRMCTRPAIWAS